MNQSLTIESEIRFERRAHGRRQISTSVQNSAQARPAGRLPRITRLMALAIRFDRLVREGEVADYAELARLGQVSRTRITQIMNLTLLAPDIQEQILFLPRVTQGADEIHLRQLQPIALTADWKIQRRLWESLGR